jgi:hypothetical protein
MSDIAINLIPLRSGVAPEEFTRFSAHVDQPICLAQDIVLGFDAFAVVRRDPGAPAVDIVEVMEVGSWDRWVQTRDNLDAMKPVMDGFERLVDPSTVRTIFARRVERGPTPAAAPGGYGNA